MMPTVLDVLRTHLLGHEAAAKLEEAVARGMAMRVPGAPTCQDCITSNWTRSEMPLPNELLANLKGFTAAISGIGLALGKAMQYLAEQPASPGYEPLFVESGWNPLVARGMARLAVRHGKRRANESKRRRPVFDAIRFLGERPHQWRAVRRCAELLLRAWSETSIIETIFDEAGIIETEFIRLLEAVVEGRDADCHRIMEIAAMLSSRLSLQRGPKVRAQSEAHEFILASCTKVSKKRSDSYHRPAEYVDALTEATRREFNDPDFDPRPARRRLKAGQRTKAASK